MIQNPLRSLLVLLTALVSLGGLTACENTIEGAKKDLKKADQSIQKAVE